MLDAAVVLLVRVELAKSIRATTWQQQQQRQQAVCTGGQAAQWHPAFKHESESGIRFGDVNAGHRATCYCRTNIAIMRLEVFVRIGFHRRDGLARSNLENFGTLHHAHLVIETFILVDPNSRDSAHG